MDPRWLSGKGSTCQCRRHRKCRFNPWVRKIPWRNCNWLQNSSLENPIDRGAWRATVHGITKSQSWLRSWACAQAPPLRCCALLNRVWRFMTTCTVAPRLLCPWYIPGKNTGVGCHFLLQGSNRCLLHFLHWRVDSLPLYHLKIKQHGDSWRNETFKMRILKYLEKNGKNSFQYIL